MDKRKLNYRFHNPNPSELLERELLKICVSANMGKAEKAIQASAEDENTLRVVAVNGHAMIAEFAQKTLFKMPGGKFAGKSYSIPNEYIKKEINEYVLHLPKNYEIKFNENEEKICLDDFNKEVAGKGEKEFEPIYNRPSEIAIKRAPINNINSFYLTK